MALSDQALNRLAEIFQSAPRASTINGLREHLVKDGNQALDEPYLPWIGSAYKEDKGLLVYATAQTGGGRGMFRLYESNRDDESGRGRVPLEWREVPIQPWRDGILPALAGVFHAACWGDSIPDLDLIASRCAVSNYYKASLSRGNGSDLNPNCLEVNLGTRFTDHTWEHFVRHEIEVLRPRAILCFSGRHARILKQNHPTVAVIECNDPAWIKHGMSGVLGRESSCWVRSGLEVPTEIGELVCRYLNSGKISKDYAGGDVRTKQSRIYLLKYFLDWQRCQRM